MTDSLLREARELARSVRGKRYSEDAEAVTATALQSAYSRGLQDGRAAERPAKQADFVVRQIGEIEAGDGERVVGVLLEGSHDAVRAATEFFLERVTLVPAQAILTEGQK